MGLLDNLKDKAEALGDKAKDGYETAKDRATEVIDDVKDRFDGDDTSADAVGDSPGGPAGSGEDAYDRVLRAAELKAEALRNSPGPI